MIMDNKHRQALRRISQQFSVISNLATGGQDPDRETSTGWTMFIVSSSRVSSKVGPSL
jgi:hypothetical protein